jgi:hypothetical protein
MLRFMSAVMAAAAIAGVLTSLSATTSTWLVASPLAKPEQPSLKPAPSVVGPISTLVPHRSEDREFRLLTNDGLAPRAIIFRGPISEARLLLESSQIQDW